METCVGAGGPITGEHGVGLDKSEYLPLIFSEDDMDTMLRVRAAFDPTGLCNPGKIIPTPRTCSEGKFAVGSRQLAESSEEKATYLQSLSVARSAATSPLPTTQASTSFSIEAVLRQSAQIVGEANASVSQLSSTSS